MDNESRTGQNHTYHFHAIDFSHLHFNPSAAGWKASSWGTSNIFPESSMSSFSSLERRGIADIVGEPVMVWARRDEVAVHRPVVVFAEGEATGGVVVAALGKRESNARLHSSASSVTRRMD